MVDLNQSTGLRTGHVVAQQAYANTTAFNAKGEVVNYLDNGLLMVLNAKGELDLANSTEGSVFVHADEEHIKFMDNASLDMFTLYLDAKEKTYPRAVALYEGDKFTTDMFKADAVLKHGVYYVVTVVNGVIQVGAEAVGTEEGPVATLGSLPAGNEAIEVLWRGVR